MKVLLIGGSGNISPAIAAELLRMGAQVTVFNRGHHDVPGTSRITGDRYDAVDFLSKVADHAFDCVIDMICYHPNDAQTLVDAFAGRVTQLIFCSTVNTYIAPALSYPVTEETPIGADPAFDYAYDKVLCERLLGDAAAKGAFNLTIVRPGATFNDQSTPVSLLGDGRGLMHRMLTGKPLIVMGDGSSLWAAAHRDDVGRAIAHAALNERAYGQGYTIASEEAMTWERYFAIASEALGNPNPRFAHIPWQVLVRLAPEDCAWVGLNFRFNNIYSSAKAKRDLGFVQTISWAEIMRRSAAHHLAAGDLTARYEHPLYDRIIEAYDRCLRDIRL